MNIWKWRLPGPGEDGGGKRLAGREMRVGRLLQGGGLAQATVTGLGTGSGDPGRAGVLTVLSLFLHLVGPAGL